MKVDCSNCHSINFMLVPFERWPPISCYNCGADLLITTHWRSRFESAHLRKPFAEDRKPDYSFPSRPSRIIDIFPLPTHRIGTSIYTHPSKIRDSSCSIVPIFSTSRASHRYETPMPTHDSVSSFRRGKTDMHSDSIARASRLMVDDVASSPIYPRSHTFTEPVLTRLSTSSKPRFCSYKNLCREYKWSLNWPTEYFNSLDPLPTVSP